MRIAIFCEAAADFATATELADRVIREQGPTWAREHMEALSAADIRTWVGDRGEGSFFDVHHIYEYAAARRILRPLNRFDERRGAPGAMMAYTAFLVARHEAEVSGGAIDAVVVVWDMDDQGDARRRGLEQARAAVYLPMILGMPDPCREAWVLSGFEPEDDDERAQLAAVRRELGFSPCEQSERLSHKDKTVKTSAKRVLAALTDGDSNREARCWTEISLDALRARGEQNGLASYLTEVRDRLLPLLSRP